MDLITVGDVVGPDHRIHDGLTIEPAYGHTLGHTMLHLTSHTEQ